MRDIGFEQQVEIFERHPGPVLESADVRRDPEGMLRKLCTTIGISFDPAMLSWAEGPKRFDGVWASHWYDAVHRSTGFAGPEGPLPEVEGEAAELVDVSLPFYQRLAVEAL